MQIEKVINSCQKRSRFGFILAFILVCFAQVTFSAPAPVKPAQLQHSFDFILKQVLFRKNIVYRSDVALPQLFIESQTSLSQFQDAVEPSWGTRPEQFTNAYIEKTNQIYLLDEADYYKKTQRCIDDSLAHELTHYVQAQYQKFNLDNDDSLEMDAVDVQTWFRETFCKI